MFIFSIVRKTGGIGLLADERFIIERIRKERALNITQTKLNRNKPRTIIFTKDDEKPHPS